MNKLKKYLFIEYIFMKMNLLTIMQYNISYFLSILYEILELGISVVFYFVVFTHAHSIAGWDRETILFMTIYAYFVDVTCTMFFIGMVSIPEYIRTGVLDLYLLKPVNKQFFLTFRRPNAVQVIGFIGSVLYFAVFILKRDISFLNGIQFIVSVGCSIVCMYSVLLIIVSLSFWITKVGDMWNAIYIINGMGAKPLEIYPKVIRWVMTFLVPSSVIMTLPSGILFGFYKGGVFISLAVSLIFYYISKYVFSKGMKRYDSACG